MEVEPAGLSLPPGLNSAAEDALRESPIFLARLQGWMEGRGIEHGTLRVRAYFEPKELPEDERPRLLQSEES